MSWSDSCTGAPSWARLRQHHAEQIRQLSLCDAFAEDERRLADLSQQAPHVFADLSKNLWTVETEALLRELAAERGLEPWRDAMLAGEEVNVSEHRAAMHWLLRMPRDGGQLRDAPVVRNWSGGMHAALVEVHETLEAMLALAGQEGVESRLIPRAVNLQRIGPLPLADVLAQLAELADIDLLADLQRQPWLEVRVKLDEPQPDLRQQIENRPGPGVTGGNVPGPRGVEVSGLR